MSVVALRLFYLSVSHAPAKLNIAKTGMQPIEVEVITTMTMDEHALMMGMFYRQARQVQVLFEVLKSNGILQGDDEAAFKEMVHSDPPSSNVLAKQAMDEYTTMCNDMGITYD
jgi:hypothetical protein